MRKFMLVRKMIFNLFINWIPINKIKVSYLKFFYQWNIGEDTKIWNNIKLEGNTYDRVTIGSNCEIPKGCCFNTSWEGRIVIGNNVVFGHDVSLYGVDHDPSSKDFSARSGAIIIENNCWIASKASVLKNVTIGEHSVIAYGAIVTKNIPKYVIAAGVPACIIKQRIYRDNDK